MPFSFLAFFAGLVDGDGYIQITKTPKGFITIKLVVSVHLKDISTLQYIHTVLKVGKINTYCENKKSPSCKLIINKTDLQEVIFPLLLHHGIFFLTKTRRYQFNLAMHILKQDKKIYHELPIKSEIYMLFKLPETASDYLTLPFFKN